MPQAMKSSPKCNILPNLVTLGSSKAYCWHKRVHFDHMNMFTHTPFLITFRYGVTNAHGPSSQSINQQHARLCHSVYQSNREVNSQMARFKPLLPKMPKLMWEQSGAKVTYFDTLLLL